MRPHSGIPCRHNGHYTRSSSKDKKLLRPSTPPIQYGNSRSGNESRILHNPRSPKRSKRRWNKESVSATLQGKRTKANPIIQFELNATEPFLSFLLEGRVSVFTFPIGTTCYMYTYIDFITPFIAIVTNVCGGGMAWGRRPTSPFPTLPFLVKFLV